MRQRSVLLALALSLGAWVGSSSAQFAQAQSGPTYEASRPELEEVLEDLIAWWPGEWSSAPHVFLDRTVRMPADGEHESLYRTFVLIEAPQVGPLVFYGQINVGDRDGPVMGRSQVLYTAHVDEARQAVVMRGHPLQDPERFVNLQDHPDLWKEVGFRDAAQIRCDFLWRRHGRQLRGLVDGGTEERRRRGPGTCSYTMADGETEFVADSEWVLSADELWIHDTNSIGGRQFLGRADRTFTRFYKAAPFECKVTDSSGVRLVRLHDRGARATVLTKRGPGSMNLLRAWYPDSEGAGLTDSLRLTLGAGDAARDGAHATQSGDAERIRIDALGVVADCARVSRFEAMPISP